MSKYIYSRVEKYRKRFLTSDPFELLDGMGVVTRFTYSFPRNGLRGFCTVVNRTKYVVINANQPEEEQRVIAGHEAGHLILHTDQLRIGTLKDMDVYNVKGKLEREANLFAADFLISDRDVLDLLQEEDAEFISVAQQLSVPAPFFAFKLYSMVDRGYNMKMPTELNSRCLK